MHPKTSKLILGTVQFGLEYGINNSTGKVSEEAVFDILSAAHEAGVRTIDTATGYGNAEEILGRYVAGHKDTSFRIITKLDHGALQLGIASIRQSLERLNLGCIHILLFHSMDAYRQAEASGLLQTIRNEQGRYFEKLGVSVYTNEELCQLIHDERIEVVQAPFNLLDNEHQRGPIMRELAANGKTIHARSVFLQGLFFKDSAALPVPLEALARYLRRIDTICTSTGIEKGMLALRYALSRDYIDGVLFGVDTLAQLHQDLDWLNGNVDASAFSAIDQIAVEESALLSPLNWTTH